MKGLGGSLEIKVDKRRTPVLPFARFDLSTVRPDGLLNPMVVSAHKRDEYAKNPAKRQLALYALTLGEVGQRFPTPICCQLCGRPIGNEMRKLGKFLWLAGSEHYLEVHDLWPPGLTTLLIHVESSIPRVAS